MANIRLWCVAGASRRDFASGCVGQFASGDDGRLADVEQQASIDGGFPKLRLCCRLLPNIGAFF